MPRRNSESIERLINKRSRTSVKVHFKNAILPGSLEIRYLSDMKLGEIAYTDPDAMVVDEAGRCWMVISMTVDDEPFRECITVQRVEDGYFVDMRHVEGRWLWAKSLVPSADYLAEKDTYAPVLKLSGLAETPRQSSIVE